MHAFTSDLGTKALLYYFNKKMRLGVQGLFVDTIGIKKVKSLISGNNRVILMPLYKSFGDFFINQYVNYKFGLESGFTFGNLEDTPRFRGIKNGWIFKSGYIFARRNQDQSLQSNYVNSALLTDIIESNKVTTLL